MLAQELPCTTLQIKIGLYITTFITPKNVWVDLLSALYLLLFIRFEIQTSFAAKKNCWTSYRC